MDGMGKHTNGTGLRGEDGAAAAPPLAIHPEFPLGRFRPLAVPWAPPRPEPEPVSTDRRGRIDGDKIRRVSMWLLASGVAVIAAVVSYSHIYDLGRAHGGSGTAARLLPLSVDMLILVGELMLLHEADRRGRRFALGWVLVWSGILATLAANVTYGYQFGVLGAVIWGWPAYSFILAAGGMVAVVKRGAVPDAGGQETTAAVSADTTCTADTRKDIHVDKTPDKAVVKRAPKRQVTPAARPVTGLDRARDIIRDNPGLSNAEIARQAKVSVKTVSRARPLAAAAPADPQARSET